MSHRPPPVGGEGRGGEGRGGAGRGGEGRGGGVVVVGGGLRGRTGEGSTAEVNLEITTVINQREGARPEEGVGGGGGGGGGDV